MYAYIVHDIRVVLVKFGIRIIMVNVLCRIYEERYLGLPTLNSVIRSTSIEAFAYSLLS